MRPINDNRRIATREPSPPPAPLGVLERAPGLYTTCQPSGGINGEDARSTGATNIKRRRVVKNSKMATRKREAQRAPKVTASRPERSDLTGTKRPRPVTNPGNKPPSRRKRSRNAITVLPVPAHRRPLKMEI